MAHRLEMESFTLGDSVYSPAAGQSYANGHVSSGFVVDKANPMDTMYLAIQTEGGQPDILLHLRPDEVAAIAWVAGRALWSLLFDEVHTDG